MKHFRRRLCGSALLALALISGCGNSENFVFTRQAVVAGSPAAGDDVPSPDVPELPDLPVAANDAFDALGNATVNIAAPGVLTNDTLNGGEITAFDANGSSGGTIDLSTDGSFRYTPALDYVGQETFDYTVSNEGGSSTATVTMTSTGRGVFVNNTASAGGDGTQANPFNKLAAAVSEAQSGDTIFVARGTGDGTG